MFGDRGIDLEATLWRPRRTPLVLSILLIAALILLKDCPRFISQRPTFIQFMLKSAFSDAMSFIMSLRPKEMSFGWVGCLCHSPRGSVVQMSLYLCFSVSLSLFPSFKNDICGGTIINRRYKISMKPGHPLRRRGITDDIKHANVITKKTKLSFKHAKDRGEATRW